MELPPYDKASSSSAFGGEEALADVDTSTLFSQVLIVEDDAAHAALIIRALKGIVGEIEHVASGAAALDALNSSYVELLLCDLHLPDITGIEIIRAARELRPGLPQIVLTSSHNLEDAVAAMKEGAWDYMVKHFSGGFAEQLRLVVEQAARRKLEQLRALQLRTERDAFWVAAHAALDGLAILGPGGTVVFANEAFKNFCQRLNPAIVDPAGLNIIEAIAEQDFSVARALLGQFSSQGADSLWSSELQVDSRGTDKKIEDRCFEITVSSARAKLLEEVDHERGELSSLRRYVLWVRDITRRKEQEKFQRDLLSTTTHDLKGPLSAILTSAELLSEGMSRDLDKAEEVVTRVASCARNAITIIDELLSARRIQDGVLVVKPRWYEVAEILEDTFLDYMPVAKAKNLLFWCDPVSEGMRIYADRIALSRVLGNLISNAIKFTPKGGKVTLSAERHGAETRISVTDSGPGIDSKVRHRLFERYSRLEQHSQIEGTGLGLFVARNIVDAHSGKIDVKSTLGEGTSFIVSFPDGPAV